MHRSPGTRPHTLLGTLLLIGAVACGGDTPSEPEINDPRAVKSNPSFAVDIEEIFDRKGCTAGGCHGSAQQGGMDLRPGAAYTSLVGVTASAEAIARVIPGDPEGSYIVMRVEGRQSVGSRMPLGGVPLDSIDITNLRSWIAQGAAEN
mgnify:CR=1 FL=1